MSEIYQEMDSIKEAFENMHKNPSIYKKKILSYLFDLRTNEEYHLSDIEFYAIMRETFKLHPKDFLRFIYDDLTKKIGRQYGNDKRIELEENLLEKNFIVEIFKSNPEDFMKFIYKKLRDKMGILYGIEKRREIEGYILEKCCLYDGEKILYGCDGKIAKIVSRGGLGSPDILLVSGCIFVTNHRIIVQGNLRGDGKVELCYGYIFPIEDIFNLRIRSNSLSYKINKTKFGISPSQPNYKEKLEKLFEILDKNRIHEEVVGKVSDKVEISPSKQPIKSVSFELTKKSGKRTWNSLECCCCVIIPTIIVLICVLVLGIY